MIGKIKSIEEMIAYLKATNVSMSEENNAYIEAKGSSRIAESIKAYELLKRPEISYHDIKHLLKLDTSDDVLDLRKSYNKFKEEIEAKYKGYIEKARSQALHLRALDEKLIPSDIDYNKVSNIALEAREKLMQIRPRTLGQASRISGVNPADIAVLSVYLETYKRG